MSENVLRHYQETALSFLHGGRRLLGDDPGLGKTPPAILAAREMVPKGGILVVGPKVAFGVWRREVARWADEEVLYYAGQPGQRAKIDISGDKWTVVSYHLAAELLKRRKRWPLVILDESHWVRNRKSMFYKAVRLAQSELLFELTGSPMVNGLPDLWAQLNLIDPKKFSSFWRFLYEHCLIERGKFGIEVGGPKNPSHTRAVLRPYFLRRTKKTPGIDLPSKQRGVIEVEHSPRQRQIYNQLCEEMVAALDDGTMLMTPSKMALMTRLRQCNITPALFGGPHASGMFEALQAKCMELFDAKQHVVVATPYTSAIPMMVDALSKMTPNMGIIQGGMSADLIDETVNWFQNSGLPDRVLFLSIRAGTSFTVTAASNIIFMGYDWTPMWNGQCEDRLHRIGQSVMVNAWYMVCRETVDEHILDVLNLKTSWNNLILNPDRLLHPRVNGQTSLENTQRLQL
jgi:SNF2 family DNA or RNA helicase